MGDATATNNSNSEQRQQQIISQLWDWVM